MKMFEQTGYTSYLALYSLTLHASLIAKHLSFCPA